MTPAEMSEFAEFLTAQLAGAVAERLANQPRLLDRHGLAEKLDVSVATVDRLRQQGLIPSKMVNRLVRFDLEAVVAALPEEGGCDG